jgi:hypothetical protein
MLEAEGRSQNLGKIGSSFGGRPLRMNFAARAPDYRDYETDPRLPRLQQPGLEHPQPRGRTSIPLPAVIDEKLFAFKGERSSNTR